MNTLKKVMVFLCWSFAGLFVLGAISTVLGIVILLKEEGGTYANPKTENAVAVVELTGEIVSSDDFYRRIRRQVENEKIKAIVVRIDSPGGAVGASEEMFQAIKQARESKPVFCSLGSVAASGGLYASLGCEQVFTNRGTLTGSIGVILAMPNFSNVMTKYGVGMNIIKSGALKDAGSPFRALSEKDRTYLQSVVDGAHSQFVNAVSTAREIPEEKVKKFADGRIILGTQAIEYGIAHHVGNVRDAAAAALKSISIEGDPEIILPKEESGFMAMLNESSSFVSSYFFGEKSRLQLLYRMAY